MIGLTRVDVTAERRERGVYRTNISCHLNTHH